MLSVSSAPTHDRLPQPPLLWLSIRLCQTHCQPNTSRHSCLSYPDKAQRYAHVNTRTALTVKWFFLSFLPFWIHYISLRNNSFRSSTQVSFGFPGQHASAYADSARKSRSSSFSASSFDGIPTSSESLRTASTAAFL